MKAWKKVLIGISVLLIATAAVSFFYFDKYMYDDSWQKQYNDRYDGKMYDSLVKTGNHGYYIRWFIVGRIRTTRVTSPMPFEITVSKIDPALEEKKISFNLNDSISCKIRYTLKDLHPELTAKFDEEKCDRAICLTVTKTNTFKPENWKHLYWISYLFEAWRY